MEWVTTTGKTVEDAKEAALDQLGIDETEAEFEILQEGKSGLFGFSRTDARVRARVLPKAPRAKQERRPRRGRSKSNDSGTDAPSAKATSPQAGEPATDPKGADTPANDETSPNADGDGSNAGTAGGGRRRSRSRSRGGSGSANKSTAHQEGKPMTEDVVNVDQQADIINEFLDGLLKAIDLEGSIERNKIDDSTVELNIAGAGDLGLLIGPKGQTLTAVHELSRTVLQRKATGRHDGRVRIDVGGYRQRRAEALARFVTAQAQATLEEGVSRALEPMNAVDRKIVHDTINEIDGVSTTSEGVDPNRRVVIVVDAAAE